MPFVSRFFSAPDGLKLHMRDYGTALDRGLPVVCLPGLSRNAADFGPLAEALADGAAGERRRVVAIDYRGRGLSEFDPDWRNYEIPVENADIDAMLTAAEVHAAVFVGTSRGGFHVMSLAVRRPALVRGAVLNDIGPVIEPQGFTRIRHYLRHMAAPGSLPDAIDCVKKIMSAQFPALSEADFETHARATFQRADGSFGLTFDPKLVKPLERLRLDEPLPPVWPLFDALAEIPLLVIRAANSDLLAPATLAEMAHRHKRCATYIAEGQGHAPLLYDQDSIGRIAKFVAEVEAKVAA
ncbi:MAG: alpha/beta hydrolase [Methylovirgula sp.]|jgi:pimeloyl-ACP methyl ester carboxylesterase